MLRIARFGLLCLGAALCIAADAEPVQEKAAPPLSIETISVTPADPDATTLCSLRIKIQNHGPQAVSRFVFEVSVNDVPLAAYKHLVYFQTIPPQGSAELKLYNFWAAETSRPAPADGKLRVQVRLQAAQWVEVAKDAKGTETSTPRGAVEGLPVERSLTLQMKRSGS